MNSRFNSVSAGVLVPTGILLLIVHALHALIHPVCGSAAEAQVASRPNLVVFVADDLGWADLGCYGSTFYETPNLDRLARDGARFTAAYAAGPVCSPTRASLMTGRWPQRTGITDHIGAPQPGKWTRNTRLLPAAYTERLDLFETTFAESLKAGGYATFLAGKWHLGPDGYLPEDQGFDVNHGGIDGGGKEYFSPYGNRRLPDGPSGEHLPDRLATEAAKFIRAHKSSPFLVYMPFYDVHIPLIARDDLRLKYEAKGRRLGLTEVWGAESGTEVRLNQTHAVYAAMVEAMDLAVGKVLAALDEHGLAKNTLVIFTSDNGGLSTRQGPTSNRPLRAGKGWLYEGGVRAPFIVRWTGKIEAGTVIDTLITSPDMMPTLLAAAQVRPPSGLDGTSLLSLLIDRHAMPERAIFWHYPHYGNQGGAPGAAIRRGEWKLIEWFEDGKFELFNVVRDPGEVTDMAEKERARVAALKAELHAWQRDVKARFPTRNPNFDPSRPDERRVSRTLDVSSRVRK